MFNVYSAENQNFYLNNSLISGIKSFSVNFNSEINTSLGIEGPIRYINQGFTPAEFNLSYVLSDADPFINYTGTGSFSGRIEYGNNYIPFTSGFLGNYSLDYKLGEYPNVNIKGIIYGWRGATPITFNATPNNLRAFNPGDVTFVDTNIDLFSNNRIQSFSINMEINRIGAISIGNYMPDYTYIQYPIRQEISINSSASNQVGLSNNLYKPTGDYISTENQYISIKRYQSNTNLITFNFNNIISDINSSFNSDGEAEFNVSRINYIQP